MCSSVFFFVFCGKSLVMFTCLPKCDSNPALKRMLTLLLRFFPPFSLHDNLSAGVSTLLLDELLGYRFLLIKTCPTKYRDRQILSLTLGEYR